MAAHSFGCNPPGTFDAQHALAMVNSPYPLSLASGGRKAITWKEGEKKK
jgi:hypothetical protein